MNPHFFKYLQRTLAAVAISIMYSCSHGPVETKREALLPESHNKEFRDDLPFKNLKQAITNTIEKLELSADDNLIDYPVVFSMNEYKTILSQLNQCSSSKNDFQKHLKSYFQPYMAFGKERYGEILLTSYYEPLIKGSLKKNKTYSTPLYKAPENLVEVKLNQFSEELYGPIDTSRKVISAQLSTDKFGNKQIIPLPSRAEIDFKGALKNKNLEIVYVDPIEAFFLHIQGSGRVQLENGDSFTVGYHAQNGMKYEPIGKFLKDDIPKDKMSLQSIEEVLRRKYWDKLEDILSLNPSYIFFKKIEGRARTTIGAEVTDRRTLAVDTEYFNLGLLGHLSYPQLEITPDGAIEREVNHNHFVLNQDTGGAIKSTGRADLFWGSGTEGKRIAGHMRHPARLTFFLPRQDILRKLRQGIKLDCLE